MALESYQKIYKQIDKIPRISATAKHLQSLGAEKKPARWLE